jgi:hypothetical protein
MYFLRLFITILRGGFPGFSMDIINQHLVCRSCSTSVRKSIEDKASRVFKTVGKFQIDQDVSVDMVKSDSEGWLIYIIQGKAYWYGNFLIII